MSKFIKNVEHKNHLNHLVVVVPILALLMFAQFFVMKSFFPEQALGNLFMFLSLSLCMFLTSFIFYDSYHKLLIFEDYLLIHSPIRWKTEKFNLCDVMNVHNPDGQSSFGTIIIEMVNKKKRKCFLIDNPHEVKLLIEKLKEYQSDKLKQAA